jgi:hypothetical protein
LNGGTTAIRLITDGTRAIGEATEAGASRDLCAAHPRGRERARQRSKSGSKWARNDSKPSATASSPSIINIMVLEMKVLHGADLAAVSERAPG